MDVESDYDFSFKVAIVGGKSVGKKSLVSKECEKDFSNPRLQRSNQKNEFIGINFQKKTYSVEGKKVLMEFWTAPSSESYMGLSSRMLSTTAAAVFVFNPYDKVSYDAAQRWISLFYKEYQAPGDSEPAIPYPPRVLLANLVEKDRAERKVSEQDARSYATRNGLLYHECNFRKKKDFNFLFISIAHKVLGPILSQKGAELPFAALERQVKVQVSLTAPLKLRFLQNVKSRRPNRNVATQAVDWLA
ncbi:P-loop containing nucleoside triphosphate hydrolase protein [Chytridium lagenaria]|nr:P-loop containing nucleoside triphosphate hydrolase protein [Chytridium lagenaria]